MFRVATSLQYLFYWGITGLNVVVGQGTEYCSVALLRVVAQLGCDRGLHQHVPLRVQSVPVVGGVNVVADTAM